MWERDGWTCQYCGRKVVRWVEGMRQNRHDLATVDHVYPKSSGGSFHLKNLVTACFRCNANKADAAPGATTSPPTLGSLWPAHAKDAKYV